MCTVLRISAHWIKFKIHSILTYASFFLWHMIFHWLWRWIPWILVVMVKCMQKHKQTILEYEHRSSFKVMVTTTVSWSLRSTIRLFDLIIMSQIDRSSKRAVQLSLCTAHAYNVRKKPVLDATAEARYIYFMSSCRTIFTAFTIYDWWQIIWIRFVGIAFELH